MIRLTYILVFTIFTLIMNDVKAQKSSFEQKKLETAQYVLVYPQMKKMIKQQPSEWVNSEILKKVKSVVGDSIFTQKTGKFKEETGSTMLMYEIVQNNQDTLSIVFVTQYLGASLNYDLYGLNLDLNNKKVLTLDSLVKDKKTAFKSFVKKYIKTNNDCQLEANFNIQEFTIYDKEYVLYLPVSNFSSLTCWDYTSIRIPKNDLELFLKPKEDEENIKE